MTRSGISSCIALLSVLSLTNSTFAQSACRVRPGNSIVLVPLQNAPNAFEPACQPARIRVNDRHSVTLRLTNLSPIDVCAVSSKPQTITPVANPIETIINSISGLKGFAFESSNVFSGAHLNTLDELYLTGPPQKQPRETDEQRRKRLEAEQAKAADDEALKLFKDLAGNIVSTATPTFQKQMDWQSKYQSDLNDIAKYLAQDYRGTQYINFQPETDPVLDTVRSHLSFPVKPGPDSPPSEVDFAELQALVDELGTLQSRLLDSCTKVGQKCDAGVLKLVGQYVDYGKATVAIATDNLKTLQTAQAAVVTSYNALDKVYLDFINRINKIHSVYVHDDFLVQDISLGPDYGATDAGSITCTSDAVPTQPTTDAINFYILFQNIPALTVSAGLLTTFQEKTVIGTTQKLNTDGTFSTYFAVTDSARAQVFPMAFVNYRYWAPSLKTWWGEPENELVITNNISGGIGVNPNTGTNQVEFFVGDAIGFNRVYIHLGAHFGRTESLGGGFQLNTVVPNGFTGTPPINWAYHPAFSIGFSVRLAPF